MIDLQVLRRLGLAPLVHAAVRATSALNADAIRIRYLWQAMQPVDPLRIVLGTEQLPEIDVLIPAHPKDLRVLKYSVAAARRGSSNPVRRVVIVVPDHSVNMVRDALPAGCVVEGEASLLGSLAPWIHEHVPPDWRGWVTQQCIKLLWARGNTDVPTLVLDADTVLLRPRTWVTRDGRQLLCFSAERHLAYVAQAARCWSLTSEAQSMSYVTHHQLMQARHLREMFPEGAASIRAWMEQADFSTSSALSEYHCYGAWLRSRRPDTAVVASFGNRGRKADELPEVPEEELTLVVDALALRYSDRVSLSFHSWKSDAA